jgi:hypothetical protein
MIFKLGAVIRAVISHMEKCLPQNEIFVFFRFFYRLIEQHIITQFCQITTHPLLNAASMYANDCPIVNVSRRRQFRGFNAAQFAEPYGIHVHQMHIAP